MIEHIIHNGEELALIIRQSFRKKGIEFFTPNDYSQQIGYMSHPKGHLIMPHVHNPVSRQVRYTKEVLFIKSGRIRIDFYSEEQKYLESRILASGDVILLAFGGHGFEMMEPTEIIEVKQGPYVGEKDKTRFIGINSDQIIFKDDINE
ncbi:MAG: hypothetical protein HQ541_11755 [Mariniphaga sp.]|nr:hypothetical protein [Mariniphaga sp.]